MSENIVFSNLSSEDLNECFELCMKCFKEDTTWEEAQKTWELCRDDPHYRFVTGKLGGKIVAFALMNIFHTLFDGIRPMCTVWYVCVDESVRRRGVGRQLFAEIERISAENNCQIICLTCLKGNVSAQEFYRSIGYSDDKETAFVKYFF